MNRTEFLEQLEEALQGEVSPAKLDENLRYYDTYIQTQVRLGRTEEEVLQQLGDPRLIARTIIDVDGQGGWGESSGPYASYSSENCREAEPSGSRARRVNTDAWYTRLGCLADVYKRQMRRNPAPRPTGLWMRGNRRSVGMKGCCQKWKETWNRAGRRIYKSLFWKGKGPKSR